MRTDLPMIDGTVALSFLELMELRIVKAFIEKGVPLQRVRVAARRIQQLFALSHPFAHRRVFTDHEEVFVGLTRTSSQPDLLQVTGRRATLQVIAGRLFEHCVEEVDFDPATSLAERWFPLGRGVPIVLDPRIAFGAPVVSGTRFRTDVLALYATGNTRKAVARAFGIEAPKVKAAIDFEAQLARAA